MAFIFQFFIKPYRFLHCSLEKKHREIGGRIMKKESGIRVLIEFKGSESELGKIEGDLRKLGIRILNANITPTERIQLFAVGSWPIPDSPASLIAINTVPIPDRSDPLSMVAINTVPVPDGPRRNLLRPIYELLENMSRIP
jgi:hypothetical protein